MRTSRIPVVAEATWYSAIHRLDRQRSSHCTTYWKTSLVLVTIQHSNERSDRINCLTHLGSKIQRSQISAFHASYRISLRSSSIHDPSDPPLRVFTLVIIFSEHQSSYSKQKRWAETRVRFLTTARMQSKRSAQALAAYDKSHHTSLTVA